MIIGDEDWNVCWHKTRPTYHSMRISLWIWYTSTKRDLFEWRVEHMSNIWFTTCLRENQRQTSPDNEGDIYHFHFVFLTNKFVRVDISTINETMRTLILVRHRFKYYYDLRSPNWIQKNGKTLLLTCTFSLSK